jgi:hypothetical protein
MEIAQLDKEEEGGRESGDAGAVGAGTHASPARHQSISLAFALKACFSLTKV